MWTAQERLLTAPETVTGTDPEAEKWQATDGFGPLSRSGVGIAAR
jgi:hypothetical protein